MILPHKGNQIILFKIIRLVEYFHTFFSCLPFSGNFIYLFGHLKLLAFEIQILICRILKGHVEICSMNFSTFYSIISCVWYSSHHETVSLNFCRVFDIFTAQVWWGDNRPPPGQFCVFRNF